MSEILEKYKNYLLSKKQRITYLNYIKILLAYLEERKLDYTNITQEIITNFFNENKYSENTINLFINAGRSFMQFLEIENSIWEKIETVRVPKRKSEFIVEKELNTLIKYFSSYETGLINSTKLEAILNFMFYTGLRKEEVLKLKRKDVNLLDNPCSIKIIGKGNKERYIYFSEKYSPGLKNKLENYFKLEEEKNNAFNLTNTQLWYIFEKIKKYLPEKNITPHKFRHSFARCLSEKGVNITYISSMLGHSDLKTTMIYIEPSEEQIKNSFK